MTITDDEPLRRGPRLAHQADPAKIDALIDRIAVVSQYSARLEGQLKAAGITPAREPRIDEVRTQVLAEGVVVELQTARAELRIAQEALAAQALRIETLEAELVRQRVSGAGVGHSGGAARRREAPPMPEPEDGHDFHPTDHEPEGGDPEDLPPPPEPTAAATPPTKRRQRRAKAQVEPKPSEREAIDAIALRLLVARGSSASPSFLVRSICDLGRDVTAAQVDAALTRLEVGKQVSRASALCGIAMWRAT